MATLLITKKTAKTWLHQPSDELQFIIGKFTFSIDGDFFQIVELGQSKRNKYNFSDITVFDETTSTTYDSFTSIVELSETLEALGYPAFLRDGEVTGVASVNGLTGIVVINGSNINVTDPTTSTDATLNNALQNILDNSGGATPDLQAVTDVGNTITDGVDTNTVSANFVSVTDGMVEGVLNKTGVQFTDFISGEQSLLTNLEFFLLNGIDETSYQRDKIQVNSVDYPLPTGVSSQIATLADITGGVSDGDKGDITVSGGGTVWTIDNGVVSDAKVASGIDATKIADGSVNNTEFQYINSLTSNAQTQLNNRVITLLNDNVDSSAVTGTTANTIIKSYLIPANTLEVGDTIDFKTVVNVTGTNATKLLRLFTNTSNSLSGALTLATLSAVNTSRYLSLDRTYTLKTGNLLQSFPTGSSAVTDESAVTNPPDTTAFNPAVDNWLLIAIQPNSASDSFVQTLCYITLMKAKTSI